MSRLLSDRAAMTIYKTGIPPYLAISLLTMKVVSLRPSIYLILHLKGNSIITLYCIRLPISSDVSRGKDIYIFAFLSQPTYITVIYN